MTRHDDRDLKRRAALKRESSAFCVESPDGHHNPEDVVGSWYWCTWCSSEIEYLKGRWRAVSSEE